MGAEKKPVLRHFCVAKCSDTSPCGGAKFVRFGSCTTPQFSNIDNRRKRANQRDLRAIPLDAVALARTERRDFRNLSQHPRFGRVINERSSREPFKIPSYLMSAGASDLVPLVRGLAFGDLICRRFSDVAGPQSPVS
jgi:hypothetical protein